MELDFLNELNEQQREAVLAIDGPLIVIAGAGSGKTRVLTYRLAFILSQGLADPQQLLALTFTNKAAREMKDRIHKLVGPEARGLQMGTFHSIFSRVLRVEAEKLGYTRNFTIYDSDDSLGLIKAILKEQRLDDKLYKPRIISNMISSAKNRLITPQKFKDFVKTDFDEKAAMVYQLYHTRCIKANAMDFGDLLMKPVQLFHSHPETLHKYQHHYKYLLVDEYQDTNHVQYLLCKALAAVHENICVVGDDAQSIYSFRGANIQNILNFKRDYPDAKEIKLEQNYRSTQNIVNAANSVISKNKDQIEKRVFTENEEGEKIPLLVTSSEQEEALRITGIIREQKQMLSFFNKDFAILYRTNAQSRALEDQLRRAGVPYKIYGGLSFYQRKEIKDIVAYLRLAINPVDEQALSRIINFPARGIGKTSLNKIVVFADGMNYGFWEALTRIEEAGLPSRITTAIKNFVTMIKSFGVAAKHHDAYDAANLIAKQTGLLKALHTSEVPEDLVRWENVQELLNATKEYTENPLIEEATLENFIAEIALFTDQDKDEEDNDRVNLMTIHSAKGLEFKSVFVVGLEENLFPSGMTETREDLEEERRLFYVAVTRAEKHLTLSLAKSRYKFGQIQYNEPSRFLEELDPKYLKLPSQASMRPERHPNAPTNPRRNLTKVSSAGNGSTAPVVDPNFEPSDPDTIATGMKVRHMKFGEGKVLSIETLGTQKKAVVFFQSKGRKVLLLKYAKLQIVG